MSFYVGTLRADLTPGSTQRYDGIFNGKPEWFFSDMKSKDDDEMSSHYYYQMNWDTVGLAQRVCPSIVRLWKFTPWGTLTLLSGVVDVLEDISTVIRLGITLPGEMSVDPPGVKLFQALQQKGWVLSQPHEESDSFLTPQLEFITPHLNVIKRWIEEMPSQFGSRTTLLAW